MCSSVKCCRVAERFRQVRINWCPKQRRSVACWPRHPTVVVNWLARCMPRKCCSLLAIHTKSCFPSCTFYLLSQSCMVQVEAGGKDGLFTCYRCISRHMQPKTCVYALLPVWSLTQCFAAELPDISYLPLLFKPSALPFTRFLWIRLLYLSGSSSMAPTVQTTRLSCMHNCTHFMFIPPNFCFLGVHKSCVHLSGQPHLHLLPPSTPIYYARKLPGKIKKGSIYM